MKGQQRLDHRADASDQYGRVWQHPAEGEPDGSQVRLRDVAKIELGGESYDVVAKFNGQPASGLGIKLATGANALDTANAIRAELAKMEPFSRRG